MSMNSITGDVAASTLKPLISDVSLYQLVKGSPLPNDQLSNQSVPSSAVDANFINKISPVKKQSPDAGIETQKKPVRAMSHVVESYNQQGKARTKFMDSHNDVIYQIPTEMVAKMEDQMLKPETSTNTKG
jgi:hypothetical protein